MKLVLLLLAICCIYSQNKNLEQLQHSPSPLKQLITSFPSNPTEVLKAANLRLQQVNEISSNNNIELVFQNDRYLLKATDQIKSTTVILQFDDQECFSDQMMNDTYFQQVHNNQKLNDDIQAFEDLQLPVWQKGLLAFAYHLYNFKQSKYYDWILTIPKQIPSLLNDLSSAQIDLLKDDNKLYQEIIEYVDVLNADFIALSQQINKDWNDTQKLSFFNNNEFTLGDYYYARHVLELCGYSRKSINSKSFFIIPSFMYIPMGQQFNNDIRPIKIFLDRPTQSLHLTVKTENDITKGEIIQINLHRKHEELYFYIALGALKTQGSTFCIDAKLTDFEQFKKDDDNNKKIELIQHISNLQGVYCFSPNQLSSQIFTQLQNILNMNSKQISNCHHKALEPFSPDEKQIQFQLQQIKEICEKSTQTSNKLDFILQQLNIQQEFAKHKIQDLELSTSDSQAKSLLISYFKLQQQMILELKEQINEIINEKKSEL